MRYFADLGEQKKLQFASDNYAGATPEVIEALLEANAGFAYSYGADHITSQAKKMLCDFFELDEMAIFFVFNGTSANSLALASMCQSYHSVICHQISHIETDECGAPEFYSNGTKLLTVDGLNGKLNPATVEEMITRRSDVHFPKPKVLSLTQSTETGTVYTPAEVKALADTAHKYNLTVHMDGARFTNAVAGIGCSPADLTHRAGVDVLCFGGTKMGMPMSEAVIFFNKDLSYEFEYRMKQAGQLSSKMRFLTAPWVAMLSDQNWSRYAIRANAGAKYFAKSVSKLSGVKLAYEPQANGVFLHLSEYIKVGLRKKGWHFYDFIGNCNRFMFNWNTDLGTIEELIDDFKKISARVI